MTIEPAREPNLLELTLQAALRDVPTSSAGSVAFAPKLPDGMAFKATQAIHDERGHLTEIFDARWDWSSEPYRQGYLTTLRPGVVKGWALHKTHEDRYFVVSGEMMLVTYDPRPESATYGLLSKLVLTGDQPRIVNIRKFVWHADWNIGTGDVVLMNFPTVPYDHANPDKYRLPLDTDLIPFDFNGAKGW